MMSMRGSASGVISSAMIAWSRVLSSSAVVSRPASASASSRSITATVAGTPQSDRSSASSSRSHTASSAGLNMTPASCCAIARRLRDRLSRSREKRPRPASAGSGSGASPSPVLNIACHVRVTTRDRSSVAAVADISIDELRSALHARAVLLGFPDAAAALITDHFLDAELRGAPTHGAERMRWLSGFADLAPTARPRELERSEGLGPLGRRPARSATSPWPRRSTPSSTRRPTAPGSSSCRTASPPAGWAGSPSGSRGAGSCAC